MRRDPVAVVGTAGGHGNEAQRRIVAFKQSEWRQGKGKVRFCRGDNVKGQEQWTVFLVLAPAVCPGD